MVAGLRERLPVATVVEAADTRVRAEQSVEGPVLLHQHDDVFDLSELPAAAAACRLRTREHAPAERLISQACGAELGTRLQQLTA